MILLTTQPAWIWEFIFILLAFFIVYPFLRPTAAKTSFVFGIIGLTFTIFMILIANSTRSYNNVVIIFLSIIPIIVSSIFAIISIVKTKRDVYFKERNYLIAGCILSAFALLATISWTALVWATVY